VIAKGNFQENALTLQDEMPEVMTQSQGREGEKVFCLWDLLSPKFDP